MTDRLETSVLSRSKAECVLELLATVQLATRQHLIDKSAIAQFGVIEIQIPEIEILNGSQKATVSNNRKILSKALITSIFLGPASVIG